MADPGGFDSLAAYLRRLCPECLTTIAHLDQVDVDTLLGFLWDDEPLSLGSAGRVSLAVLQMKRDSGGTGIPAI